MTKFFKPKPDAIGENYYLALSLPKLRSDLINWDTPVRFNVTKGIGGLMSSSRQVTLADVFDQYHSATKRITPDTTHLEDERQEFLEACQNALSNFSDEGIKASEARKPRDEYATPYLKLPISVDVAFSLKNILENEEDSSNRHSR